MTQDIPARIRAIRDQIARAAARADRAPEDVRIVAVAKTQPPATVQAAVDAGIEDIGENYVQEAQAKAASVHGTVRWHLVGRLQRNKVKAALQLFSLIHSVDSVALLNALEARARDAGRTSVDVLFEVNLAGEASKAGVAPDALEALFAAALRCPHVRVCGLMCIPPPPTKPEDSRPYFRQLRELRDYWQRQLPNAPLHELSMGMSDDFAVAVEEGATLLRIGRAIFGERRSAR
ncbi:MAG: YggS family pyridoxal phosphate-dependent enzyme [Candidatus Binatia bacterium]|nr:YggS family pyridoxal phosphate-dependent enzyme [Candidatus Binatia bacterium]